MPTLNELIGEKDTRSGLEKFVTGFKGGFKETTIPGIYRFLTRPSFDPVDGYDPIEDVKERYPDLYSRYMSSFADSVSPAETDYIAQKLNEYEQNVTALSSAGPIGVVGAFVSGLADPISYIPLYGAARKVYGVKRVSDIAKAVTSTSVQFGLAATASTAIGGIDRPEFKPNEELMTSFLYGAAVGAILGGAAGGLHFAKNNYGTKINNLVQKVINKSEEAVDELDNGGAHKATFNKKVEEGVPPEQAARDAYVEVLRKRAEDEESRPVYAASPEEAVNKTVDPVEVSKQGLLRGPLGRSLTWLDSLVNPVVAVAESSFETARKIQGLIADAGLVWKATADGKVVAPIGTIENRIHGYHYGMLAELMDNVNYAYGQWLANKESRAFSAEFADTASSILGTVGRKDLSKQTFSQLALREYALGKGYSSKATQIVGDNVQRFYERFAAEMESTGLVEKKILLGKNEYGQPYLGFKLDSDKIVTHSNEFLNDVAPYVVKDVKIRLNNFSEKQKKKLKDLLQLKDDLSSEDLVAKSKEIYDSIEQKRQEVFKDINERFPQFEEITGIPISESILRSFDTPSKGTDTLLNLKRAIKKRIKERGPVSTDNPYEAEAFALEQVGELNKKVKLVENILRKIKNEDERYLEFKRFKNKQNRRLRQIAKYLKDPAIRTVKAEEKVKKGIDHDKAARTFYRYASRVSKLLEFKNNKITDMKRLELGIKRALDAIDSYSELIKALDKDKAVWKSKKGGYKTRDKQPGDKSTKEDDLIKRYRYWRVVDNAVKRLDEKLKKAKDLNEFFDSPEWKTLEDNIEELVQEATERVLRIGEEYGRYLGKTEDVIRKAPKSVLKKIDEEIKNIEELLNDLPVDLVAPFLKETDEAVLEEMVKEYIRDTVIVGMKKDNAGINSTLRMALQKERGSELPRLLFRRVPNEVMIKYIYNDVESMARAYIRTVAPDIELRRTFGTVQIQEILEPLKKELSKKLKNMPDGPEKAKLKQEHDRVYRLLEIQLQRLRGTRGVAARGGHVSGWDKISEILINWAIGSKLGSVLFPSMGDLGKMGMKAGQMKFVIGAFRTIKSKFNKGGFNYTKAALQYGVSERLTAMRLRHMFQLYEDHVPSEGKLLNFSRWGANKTIKLSGMPLWNQFAKEIAIATTMAAFNPMIKKMAEEGAKSIPKRMRDVLLQYGIDEDMAKRIMKQVKKDPETWWHVDDYDWSPNVDNWDDVEARLVYQSFMAGEYNRAVVTPGLEKPEWADGSNIGKLAYQFRGYLFSSTSKLFLAGLQHPDLSLAATYAISTLLGGLQLYARAYIIGGDYWDRVKNWPASKWIDMAIDQGAPIGILTEVNRLALLAGIPYGTLQYWLDGTNPQRNRYYTREDLTKLMLGPSLPMLLYDAVPLAFKFKDAAFGDSEITARDIHRLRGLLFGQNIFYLSWTYDLLEKVMNNAFDIPEM